MRGPFEARLDEGLGFRLGEILRLGVRRLLREVGGLLVLGEDQRMRVSWGYRLDLGSWALGGVRRHLERAP